MKEERKWTSRWCAFEFDEVQYLFMRRCEWQALFSMSTEPHTRSVAMAARRQPVVTALMVDPRLVVIVPSDNVKMQGP